MVWNPKEELNPQELLDPLETLDPLKTWGLWRRGGLWGLGGPWEAREPRETQEPQGTLDPQEVKRSSERRLPEISQMKSEGRPPGPSRKHRNPVGSFAEEDSAASMAELDSLEVAQRTLAEVQVLCWSLLQRPDEMEGITKGELIPPVMGWVRWSLLAAG